MPEPEQRLRLGVAGCGQVFERYHLPALLGSPDWQVDAACDPFEERRARVRAAFPRAECFERVSEMLSAERLDALLVATPPASHCEVALAGLDRGCHILVEKPMALSAADARSMLERARSCRKVLGVGFNRRFRRTYVELEARLRRLPPGALRSARFEFLADAGRWTPAGARRRTDDDAAADLLHDVACHHVDLLPWLTGRRITRVSARPGTSARHGMGADPSTILELELRLAGGGGEEIAAHCVVGRSSRYRERLEVELLDHKLIALPGGVFTARPSGARWQETVMRAVQLVSQFASKARGKPGLTADSFERQLGAFAAAVRACGDRYRGADGDCGLRSVLALEACLASLADGGAWKTVAAAAPEARLPCP